MSRRRGFSLIEALVALIVASMALLAVYALQEQLARGQLRYQRALAAAGLRRDAMALTEEVNPMSEPVGERPLAGGRRVRWTSTPLTDPRPNAGYPSGVGRYEVRLYRLSVLILDAQGRRIDSVAFDRLGWRRLDTGAGEAP